MRGRFYYILLFSFFSQLTNAQDVIIQPPLFNTFGCNELVQAYSATVTNFSDETYQASGLVEIFHSSPNASMLNKVAEVRLSSPGGIDIAPGLTTFDKFTYQSLAQVNVSFQDRSFEAMIRNAKCLPPGNYEICFYLFADDGSDRGPVLDDYLTRTCYTRDIENFSPLLLVTPFDRDTIMVSLPLFSWTAITPVNLNAFYTIEIVELFGRQTPFEAFRSNPLFYKGTRLGSNIHQYPIASRPLNPCSSYAWRVMYSTKGGFDESSFTKPEDVLIDSELWTFQTSCDEDLAEDEDEDAILDNPYRTYYNISDFDNQSSVLILDDFELNLIIDNPYKSKENFSYQIFSGNDLVATAECCINNDPEGLQSELTKSKAIPVQEYGSNKYVFDVDQLGLQTGKVYKIIIDDYKIKRELNFKIELE